MNCYKKLIDAASAAKENSYSPYSKFKVGAALLAKDGTIYCGANIENASFSATVCAERVALYKAVFDGKKDFTALAIAGDSPAFPCGVCLQSLCEFSDMDIIIVGKTTKKYKLSELLTHTFKF